MREVLLRILPLNTLNHFCGLFGRNVELRQLGIVQHQLRLFGRVSIVE